LGGKTVTLLDSLRELFDPSYDPYQYECTVCGTTFTAEQSSCPECGGPVEREKSTTVPVDPQP